MTAWYDVAPAAVSGATIRASMRNVAKAGAIGLIGQGFGSGEVRYGAWAHDADLFNPQGSTIAELHEVIALAKSGEVVVEVEQFSFDEVVEAYDRLKAGTLNGRAVVLPNG